MSSIEHIIRLIAPYNCLGCNAEDHVLCSACAGRLPVSPVPRAATVVWPATTYKGLAKDVIHILKFERAGAAAEDIADCMVARLPAYRPTLVSFMPTAPPRVRQRGYDQARLIARAVARRLGVPCLPLLARLTNERQVGQTRAVRQTQQRQAFRLAAGISLSNQMVLLVDDVITTGATIDAGASLLQAAGAAEVRGAVFAAA
jgi:predicted amidophosphoribosyltransferase